MANLWWPLVIADLALVVAVILSVLRRRAEPMSMVAWILAALALPFVGPALYVLIGANRIRRRAARRRRKVANLIEAIDREAADRASPSRADAPALPPEIAVVEEFARRMVQIPAVGGNEVRVYGEAEETYTGLESAIRSAEEHIHLQYYIWKPDATGIAFRDLVIQKAREGVACRVLLDSVGCWGLKRRFYQPMIDAGVRVGFFMPLYPSRRRRWSPHLRNHRKIAVVDGRTAFMGSQNIGDEYRGRLKRLSPWYDTHLRLRGPAALFIQQVFAEDWVFATGELLAGEQYFPCCDQPGRSQVQIVPTGPDHDAGVLDQIAFAAVAQAREVIRIATPYFVPHSALRMALTYAARRGVKVQLVLPTRSDNLLVLWAGRSFYAELLTAGVEIFEFDAGMLHSKIVTVDDRWCMVGSANMDVRSFRLNFELTALIYDEQVSRDLALEIEHRCDQSRRVSEREVWSRGLWGDLAEGAARLFAPLL
ncbi:MAG: cardiolipin synthase [Planctomycetota bacterium]